MLEHHRGLRDARDRAWYAWRGWYRKEHLDQADPEPDARSAWEAAWNQGGADALRRSAQAAELTLRLEELTTLYRELETGSPYWHTIDGCKRVYDTPESWHWEHSEQCLSKEH